MTTLAALNLLCMRHAEARRWQQRALELLDQRLSVSHGIMLGNLAQSLRVDGEQDRARMAQLQSLASLLQRDQADRLLLAGALNNLAESYRQQQSPEEAIALASRALGLVETLENLSIRAGRSASGTTQDDSRATSLRLTVLNNLGLAQLSAGRYFAAEESLAKALALTEKSGGLNGPGCGKRPVLLGNLALAVHSRGDHVFAQALLERAVKLERNRHRQGYPQAGEALALQLSNLALVAQRRLELGDHNCQDPQPFWDEASALLGQDLGPGGEVAMLALENLHRYCRRAGQADTAARLQRRLNRMRQ